jgi:hypothetical protein
MATLPANDDMTGAGVTQGQFKARLNDLLTFCRDVFGSNGSVAAVRTALGLGNLATRNEVTADDIPTGAVTAAKIADGVVGTAKIADAAITAAKLAGLAVGSGAIAAGAVTTAKIANLAVGTGQLADGAVSGIKIADGAVGSAKIGDGQVINAKLADAAVTASKIADRQVNANKLTLDAVNGVNIGAGADLYAGMTNTWLMFRRVRAENVTSGSGSQVAGVSLDVYASGGDLVVRLTVALYAPPPGGGGGEGGNP